MCLTFFGSSIFTSQLPGQASLPLWILPFFQHSHKAQSEASHFYSILELQRIVAEDLCAKLLVVLLYFIRIATLLMLRCIYLLDA